MAAAVAPSAAPVVLVTRPAADAGPLMDELAARGYAPLLVPMLRIENLDDVSLDLDDVTGLLFTSANGVRALCAAARRAGLSAAAVALPVFAVGDATARAARAAGFRRVDSAGGDVTALAALVTAGRRPADGPLLHVAGSDVAGDLAGLLMEKGFSVRRMVLYQAVAADVLDATARTALAAGAAAVFFSPRTARAFVSLATAGAPEGGAGACAAATACCLSPAVAAAAGDGWGAVRIATFPTQASLLEMLPPLNRHVSGA